MILETFLPTWQSTITPFLQRSEAVAIAIFSIEETLVYANEGMQLLLGTDQDITPARDYLVVPSLANLFTQTKEGLLYEGWLTFGGPNLRHRSLTGQIWQQQGHLLILAAYDVTEMERINREIADLNSQVTNLQREMARKNAHLEKTLKELKKTQAMLIQSEKMNALGQITAGIAHEINNPISFISSNLYSLEHSVQDLLTAFASTHQLIMSTGTAAQQRTIARIAQEADIDFLTEDIEDMMTASTNGLHRIQLIVDDLRKFSRLDEAAFKEIDLLENIKSTLSIVGPELKTRVEVILDIADLPLVYCYPAELNQLFLNLIINASQAIEKNGRLTIQAYEEEGNIVLIFADTGRGIPATVIPFIFDPFFTTKPIGQGTGLGLSIAYNIITHRHGGTIDVHSVVGKGTTFTIRLPKE